MSAEQLADHLFRRESGRLVSTLTRIFGVERLQLAEDVVQEALVRAMQTWPYHGVPDNPAAWLTQTAKNLALDVVRREKRFQEKEPGIVATIERWSVGTQEQRTPRFDDEIADDGLGLMFACCHPAIPMEARVALALKTLCGFGVTEIASAFLSSDAAVSKRLTRARQKLRESGAAFEIPTGVDAAERLEAVEQTLYLLFNEGYKASTGDHLIRHDLCAEAIRLCALLVEHPVGNRPRTRALAALMCLNASRLPARTDEDGHLLRLKDQDRSKWDRALIARGLRYLADASEGDEVTSYHLQAGMSACHCAADDYDATDWPRILTLYDRLAAIDDSPVVALNRAVAVAQVHGPDAGIAAIEAIPYRKQLDSYYLLYSVLGEFETQRQNFRAASEHFKRALELTPIAQEQSFLAARLNEPD